MSLVILGFAVACFLAGDLAEDFFTVVFFVVILVPPKYVVGRLGELPLL
jgi:hypothetical protein